MNRHLASAQQLATAGQFSEAADLCRRSIKMGADVFQAKQMLAGCLYNIGVAQYMLGGLLAEAEKSFQAALAANPRHLDALNNLAAIQTQTDRLWDAIASYQTALKLTPKDVRILENLAKIQQRTGQLHEASQTLRKLAHLSPDNAGLYLIREALLVEGVAPNAGYPKEIRYQIEAKLDAIPPQPNPIANPNHFPAAYFPLSYHGMCNRDLVQKIAAKYLQLSPSLSWQAPHIEQPRDPSNKIRIGIASHFFSAHSIGNTSRGLVEQLDRSQFEVHLIRLGASKLDSVAQEINNAADHVTEVSSEDLQEARETIAKLELDILFYQDIGMDPLGYFLAFARLARAQLTSFGHPDTTGIPNLDYFLSSSYYETSGAASAYSERLILIPEVGTLSYYHRPPVPAITYDKAKLGLGQDEKIYLCPQTLFKIHPDMDELFLGILERDPNARIVLIDIPQYPELKTLLMQRMERRSTLLTAGVLFIPTLPYPEFLALLKAADIILDTLYFNGQNTSLEAFSIGTPVITLPGTLQRERHTYGMYRSMDFLELVASNFSEFIDKAVNVANDANYRTFCQTEIMARSSILYENIGFVRHCEIAFKAMLQ